MGIKSNQDARVLAEYAGFDLVLISTNGKIPVCKLTDYSKFKYEKKKQKKEALKKQRESQLEMKEYRLSPSIDIHDFNTRKVNAERYLVKGHKIKVSIRFKGRQMAHPELGEQMLMRFADSLNEVSEIETKPKMDGKIIYMILAPKK